MSLIKTIKKKLKRKKSLRDNDRMLMCEIWAEELKKLDASPTSFLKLYEDGLLSSAENIRRRRQEVQEYNPSLRGKRYNLRHRIADKVRERIRDKKRILAESENPGYGFRSWFNK